MNVIYKYECVPGVLDWVVQLPQGAEILSLGTQHNNYVYWAKVDSDAPLVPRRLKLLMTGQPFGQSLEGMPEPKYCGSCVTYIDTTIPFVLHLFDLGEVPNGDS